MGRKAIGAAALFLTAAAPVPSARPDGTLVATGQIEAAGLHGTWQMVTDLRDGRFADRTDLLARKTADIFDGRTQWRVEPSGGSHKLDSWFARRRSRTTAWLARFGWLQPAFGGAARSAAITKNDAGRRYSVVMATPPSGIPVELWFDPATDRLARAVQQDWFRKVTTLYADYRTLGALQLPFSIVRSDGDNEERIAVASYHFQSMAPPGSYAAPRQPDDHSVPAAGTKISATIFPQLVVHASVNGHPMDFLFDTGGHSVLSPEAARTLGLSASGTIRSGGTGAGTIGEQFTHVAALRMGDAVMHDQAFSILDLGYGSLERGARPPLAGLLGLEVVERFITRIDYRAGTLTLLPREASPACRSGWVPTTFTDDMPTVNAVLDGVRAPFTIDTGNNGTIMLYAHWLQEHHLGGHYNRGVETVSYGAGGSSRNWVSYAHTFRVKGGTVRNPMVRTSDDKGGVSLSISEAGNLGTNTLANYDITFDYGRSRVCMDYVPGYQPVPFNRAGLRAIKTDPETILLSLVNEGGPAARAGLQKDDRLLSVDGRAARMLSGGDLTLSFTRPPGTHVQVRYARGTKIYESTLVLRDLLPHAP